MKDDTPNGQSIETTVLEAIDQAAESARAPVRKASRDAWTAKWLAVVAVLGLVFSLLALGGVAKTLHDSRQASVVYRNDACLRGNTYRADDLAKWLGLLALAVAPDPSAPPKRAAVVKRDAARLVSFRELLLKADAPIDCVALSKKPN